MKFQFPHVSRYFSAMTILWLALGALIAVNILAIQRGRPAHWDKLMMLFEMPFSTSRSVDLASLLWQQGYKEEARSVLGATTDASQAIATWEEKEVALAKKYAFWQTVAGDHPDYRDAFITLAALAYQMGKFDEARSWISRAHSLDPNSPTVEELTKFMK